MNQTSALLAEIAEVAQGASILNTLRRYCPEVYIVAIVDIAHHRTT